MKTRNTAIDKRFYTCVFGYTTGTSWISFLVAWLTELFSLLPRSDIDITNIQVRESEVIDILKILKVNKATGPDGISNRMLKSTCNTVCAPLTRLFNLSLRDHQYPGLWKVAHVMPLFKKGDKSLTSNYRPVSLTSNVGKSFERIVFKHLYNHIIENNLLYKYTPAILRFII